MPYPDAPRQDVVDILFDRTVADPYRWLEDAGAAETVDWSAAQDRITRSALDSIAERDEWAARLRRLVPGFTGAPVVVGERSFWTGRAPDQDHPVLRTAPAPGGHHRGSPAVDLVDPNVLSATGTTTLDGWAPSLEGDRLAYLLSEGGDEESRLWVIDVDSGEVVDGPIDRIRYSPLAWLPGGRQLLYVRRLAPEAVPEGEAMFHRRVWLHTVGADPDTDVMVFGDGVDLTAYLGVEVSHDGQWVAVTVSLGTAPRNDVHLARWAGSDPAALVWADVAVGLDARSDVRFDRQSQLWVLTDLDAPRRRLCVADPETPGDWRTVVPEDPSGAVLEDFGLCGSRLVVITSHHALSAVSVHDRAGGELVAPVGLPGAGTVGLTTRADEGPEAWLGYTDYATPHTLLHLDTVTLALDTVPDGGTQPGPAGDGDGSVDRPQAHSRQVTCISADGTEVQVTVISPTAEADRHRPTVLYGYGGFNVAMTPAYSSQILAWVASGGVWAVANLRGGSEEGEQWHRDGMRANKHHVFEDFEAAADVLVSQGWTTTAQLGIMGGSNGGLLVGAALTRSPGRYRAVVCSAPLLDMVRYELFGLGATWNDEFGTAADPGELEWLLSYSPYHNVTDGVAYPGVLFTVFDGDSRVDPLHARKMAAALQHATSCDPNTAPVLLRREADVGHGARSVTRTVELAADQLAFLWWQLGG